MIFAALIFSIVLELGGIAALETTYNSLWHYKCNMGLCQKGLITKEVTSPMALSVCQLTCGDSGSLWPKPTGHLSLGRSTVHIDPDLISFEGADTKSPASSLLHENVENLRKNVKDLSKIPIKSGGSALIIGVSDIRNSNDVKLTLDTDESYTLLIYQVDDNKVNATISAKSYFGARHGLETLSQLIVFDDLRDQVRVAHDVYIQDRPVFPYRGILLDTARNFVDVPTIKRTIEAMGMSKLNTLHWHITDSQSFPYESETYPLLSKYGAYSRAKVYTKNDVKEIIKYGLVHGVRILPEFDAPAHVGEGWQWVGDNATVCFNAEPWQRYCVEPPCGQLNPTSEKVYEILEGIYRDMLHDFQPDIFHMGGDEAKALDKLTLANGGEKIPVILWTSALTNEENIKYLDPLRYIVQIWTTGKDPTIGRLIRKNFRVILSNYDALYLDCGFGAWVGEGNNWCSPYKGWQLVYDNSPFEILREQGFGPDKKSLVLGGEATLWTEQADSVSIDFRLWPRSAALAERLWTNPSSSWIHAEQRMLKQRERLVNRGIATDRLEPEWCMQNQGHCYL